MIWVRTQEDDLVNLDKMEYVCKDKQYTSGECKIKANNIGGFITLATYKSEERCLEIIEELQKHISNLYKFRLQCISQFVGAEIYDNPIYVMPKE